MRFFPWLTLSVFAATAATTAAMLAWPAVGAALERSPAILGGEIWRLVTTWLVETDGPAQIAVNFAGLAIFGTLVERLVGRRWWVIGYVVAGLTGEIAGLFWQPVGGGNSVAICGLIGLFSMWQVRRQRERGASRYLGSIIWMGLGAWLTLHRDLHGPALLMGFAVGACALFRRIPDAQTL